MSFSIPQFADLAASVRAAMRAEMPGVDANLWPNNLNPTAKTFAGALRPIYLRLAYIADQIFAATAEGQWLDRHAAEFGLARNPPAAAAGNITATATTALTVAAGAILARGDGATFSATAPVSIASAGTLTIPVVATSTGAAGNTLAATVFTATSGIVGAATYAADASGLGTGSDIESDDALRARILFRKRFPPQGGAPSDYVEWGQQAAGVTRVFVERLWAGPGTVRVFPLTDGLTAGGIPVASSLAAATAAILANAPAGAGATIVAPAAQSIDVTISGLSPNTVAVQQAVLAELASTFLRLGRVSGSDPGIPGLSFLATAQTFSRSWIWQAVANAAGEERHSITTPSADVTIAAGSIPVLGVVTFA